MRYRVPFFEPLVWHVCMYEDVCVWKNIFMYMRVIQKVLSLILKKKIEHFVVLTHCYIFYNTVSLPHQKLVFCCYIKNLQLCFHSGRHSKLSKRLWFIHIYIYIYIYPTPSPEQDWTISSSSSCRDISTDIPDPLSPLLPVVHRFRQVLRGTARIVTELLYVSASWSPCFCSARWMGL